jgi:hypothetical protein
MSSPPPYHAETGCPLLDALPFELLQEVGARVAAKEERLRWRLCARQLLAASDASNTSLRLGAAPPSSEAVLGAAPPSSEAVLGAAPPSSEAVMRLVRRTPRLATLDVAAWWEALDWRAVLSAAAGSLRELHVPPHDHRTRPDRDGTALRVIGETCGATLRSLRVGIPDSGDLSRLGACTALQDLRMEGIAVTSVAPLAACKALRRLEFSITGGRGAEAVDLAPLAACTALEHLDLGSLWQQSLAPLASCTALKRVGVSHNGAVDLAPLDACTALEDLSVSNCGAVDLAPLAACKALQKLDVSNSPVADLGPLAACTALLKLDVSNTGVADLAPLAACTALQKLDVSHNRVADLAPLAACTALLNLDVSHNRVVWLAPLAACKALRYVDLSHNYGVTGLAALDACTALDLLYAFGFGRRLRAAVARFERLHPDCDVSCD